MQWKPWDAVASKFPTQMTNLRPAMTTLWVSLVRCLGREHEPSWSKLSYKTSRAPFGYLRKSKKVKPFLLMLPSWPNADYRLSSGLVNFSSALLLISASGRGCVKTQIPKIRVVNSYKFAWFLGSKVVYMEICRLQILICGAITH